MDATATPPGTDGARTPQLEASWLERLAPEFEQPYMRELSQFLRQQKRQRVPVFPAGADIFRAFELTPFDQARVVIVGQDPYHGPGQAHGLCFSVPPGVRQPPSLVNIFKELHADLGIDVPDHGNLEAWARQGVLLLNSTLTVQAHRAGSHQGKGWERFTDAVIDHLNREREGLVFLLWGRYATNKASAVDTSKHLVLTSAHPSPLSAHNGFFGSRPFSKINAYLEQRGEQPIDWRVPPC